MPADLSPVEEIRSAAGELLAGTALRVAALVILVLVLVGLAVLGDEPDDLGDRV